MLKDFVVAVVIPVAMSDLRALASIANADGNGIRISLNHFSDCLQSERYKVAKTREKTSELPNLVCSRRVARKSSPRQYHDRCPASGGVSYRYLHFRAHWGSLAIWLG